jgi:hypothetical protein
MRPTLLQEFVGDAEVLEYLCEDALDDLVLAF